jgi:sugar (pentulose or hexulose) kinase
MATIVVLIFDIGKTNKKILLFNQQYEIVYEQSENFDEIVDEDGFPCENVALLTNWITDNYNKLNANSNFQIKAVNFSAYGASFVYLNKENKVFLPLYNYLKPLDKDLQDTFYQNHGGEVLLAKQTASPVLGNLNSGMQLYRLKIEKPKEFEQIKYALHLPQYLSFLLSGEKISDITSVGCHTNLWNFEKMKYHSWVAKENLLQKFAPLISCTKIAGVHGSINIGTGLHDSSAALIPYLTAFSEPFILLSTGTWCISLNPFNHTPLTNEELQQDCLCYLSYKGTPVKASRLFAGYEHEQQTKRLAEFFHKEEDYYKTVKSDMKIIEKSKIKNDELPVHNNSVMVSHSQFAQRELFEFLNFEEAYHQLIGDIMQQQINCTNLVLNNAKVKRIFVDGGFSKNSIYMHLLANAYPTMEVFAVSVAQASAIGAAMAIHEHWNDSIMPSNNISLQLYTAL